MVYYPFCYDRIFGQWGWKSILLHDLLLCSILYAMGEKIYGHILKGCRNGHLEKHDGCGRLKAYWVRDGEGEKA